MSWKWPDSRVDVDVRCCCSSVGVGCAGVDARRLRMCEESAFLVIAGCAVTLVPVPLKRFLESVEELCRSRVFTSWGKHLRCVLGG